jgi:predicted nucleotidyltransferase
MTDALLMNIPDRELNALRELNRSGVEYVLIGGCAMRHYGVDRDTSDVDLWASDDQANLTRLFFASERIIRRSLDYSLLERLLRPGRCKHLPLKKDGINIDLLTSQPGLECQESFARRDTVKENGVEIPVVSPADLLHIKRRAVEQGDATVSFPVK